MRGFHSEAWVTYALCDQDVIQALTLSFSLKRVLTTRKLVVMASPQISTKMKQALNHGFDFVSYLQTDLNTAELGESEFVKLSALTLVSFEKLLYLSPNMMVMKNCDELFDEEPQKGTIWIENQDATVLLAKPSMAAYQAVMEAIREKNGSTMRKSIGKGFANLSITMPQSGLPVGKETDVSIVNLGNTSMKELATTSSGLIGELVLKNWKEIEEGYVLPLLQKEAIPESIVPLLEYKKEPIAVIGMACRYPGAKNLEEFWNILVGGEDAIGNPPEFRWLKEQCSRNIKPEFRKTNAGFLTCPVDEFDSKFFNISPKEMIFLDPQHRLLHELVWEGLEDAAVNPQELRGTSGSVFIGSWTNDYKDLVGHDGKKDFYREYMGNSIGAAAARISFLLGMTGPSIATESGCSSAMVAVHLACKSLQNRETSFALACGVNLLLHPFDKDEMPVVLSPEGRCKTFDAKADGFARAEGCGVLVLKRLSDAVRDGDKIWALIRGSGMTQEGVSKSMGTPTVHCESLAMKNALQDASVAPDRVSYVEAHGTGTVVGDPMEIAAIAKAYHSKERKEPLLIGSVKTNVGHTESCSGITGIMKVVLAMQNEIIPPHRNFDTLNPSIRLEAVPAVIPLKPVEWRKIEGVSRLAGVSSFGISGTDAHAIIEESPTLPPNALMSSQEYEREWHILKICAKSDEAIAVLLDEYKTCLKDSDCDFKDLAYTANVGRADFSHRTVIIAKSLELAVKNIETNKMIRGEASAGDIKVCFLFTGQGSQYPGMAKQLYETSPVFRMHFEYCEKTLKKNYNIDITKILWSEAKSAEVSRTIYSQTSIFCVEYALLKLWESWGVKADFALGHSLGEFAAAVCAGILSVEDALMLVAERSRLIDQLPRGKMLVIKADMQKVDTLMKKFAIGDSDKILDYAAVNSAEQTVVAGDAEVVLHFGNFCKENNLKCIVLEATHAFHSKHMDPMLDDYRKVAKTVKKLNGNDCSFISGVHGDVLNSGKVDVNYWVQHTRQKVSFLEASKKAVSLGCKVFIEIGPQPVLSALTMMNNDTPLLCLPSLKRNENEWETLLNTLGNLYVKGLEIDWKGLDQFCNRKKVTLPHYPFIGKKFWPDLVASTGSAIHPLLGSPISNASSTKLFQSGLNLGTLEYVKDHAIGDHVIFPGAGYLEMCLAAGLATVEGSNSSLAPPTRPMKVENLSIEAPLCLIDSKTCQVQTVVELNENEGDWNDMKVSIFRRGDSDSGKWLPHARATFSPIPTAEEKQIQFDLCKFKETIQLAPNGGELSQFYGKLASVGLKFGPTFRSIEKIWRSDSTPTTMLAKVKVPPNDGGNPYIIHPVVLDAMIQAMMMLRHASNIKKKLYVPIKIGKFLWLQEMDSFKDIYIHVNNASALLVDSTGTILAQMTSVDLIDTTVKALESVLEQQTISMPDMWEEVWRSQPGPLQYTVDLLSATNTASAEFTAEVFHLMEKYNNLPPQLAETFSQVEKLTYLYFLKALYDCGWKPEPRQEFATAALQHGLGIQPAFRQYFGFILETLEIEGILEKRKGNVWKLKSMPPSLTEVVAQISCPLLKVELVQKFAPTLLLSKYGEHLGAILRGKGSALSILFPEENKGEISVHDFYRDYGKLFLITESALKATGRQFDRIRSTMKGQRFVVKILEVGAGTGSYSQDIIHGLETEGIEYEYTYTDISAAFFPAAQKKFEKCAKSMKFKKLNIEEDPISQGFAPEYFDYVYVAEVIHATRDIRETLRNIRMLMKPFGKVDIIDQTRENRIITYLFGGLEGFWRFQDLDIRTRHCTLDPQRWEQVFRETGFKIDAVYPIVFGYHSCMSIYKSGESQLSIMRNQMSVNKAWVLFDEANCSISGFLKENIENSAARKVFSVRKGDSFQEVDGGMYEVRSYKEEDFHSLYSSIKTRGLEVEGVVYCWALNKAITSQNEILQPFFHLTKAAMELPGFNPRILAVTNGGVVPLVENDLSHFYPSTLCGFTKSLKNENVNINCSCVELIPDPGEKEGEIAERRLRELFHEIWNWNRDVQVAYSGGSRFIPKFVAHKPLTNALTLPKGTDKYQLILPATKAIGDLSFGPLELGNLKEDEVEVQIKASALNFRDVLSVIKPTEQFKDINAVGFDFGGVVKRVGANVTKWKVGDLVCGCNIHFTALPSHVHLSEDILIPLSPNMTLCEAATIPAVYMTSIVCLLDVAKIQKEDVVLLHTASGGVGLSAMELCKYVGCTVIATAGSKRKQNYLRSIGIQHIFHSRNTQYGDQILELTNGRGVDVVLNSLTSEGFKEATLKACAKGARFIEMSKLNIWTPEEVKQLRPDVEYTIVDVSSLDLKEFSRLSERINALKELNAVKPIPYVRFDGLNIREALNYMQKAKHVGKIVCVMPELRQEEGKMKVDTPMFNNRSTYLITGGLGGIGFVVCKWMLGSGAKHVIIASRKPPSSSIQAEINEMNSRGANVIPIQLDVGNFEECRDLIEVQIEKMGLPPLRGVMHAAGTLADGVILNQDWSKLSSTFSTKINGTINLHELTKNLNLEHFVMFSSMASILGPPGQCNHAAGNCFEDAITHYRNSMGLPATTVNWGPWGEVGVATEADLPGVNPLSNLHGTTGLEYVLKSHRAQTCILNVSSFVILSKLFPHLASYLDERIWKKSAVAGIRSVTIKTEEFWQQYDSAGDLEEKTESLKTQLKNILRNTLKLEENDVIGDDIDLQQIGVDSLMFVEIKNGLQTLLGDRLTVNASSLKDSNTVNLIVSTLFKLIEGAGDEGETVAAKPTLEEVTKLIREDSQLPEKIGAKPGQEAVAIPKIKTVLLTGCTGTLGPYVLKELTKLPQITQVVCLLRPFKNLSADERLAKVLSGKHLLSKVDMGKIRCVPGNVAEPYLGMEPIVWEELSGEIDAVFNCAASVRHTEYYRKGNSKQKDIRAVNIGGTINLLEFACEKRLKHVYHASSLLAVATIDEQVGKISEHWPEVGDYDNVTTFAYPVSKFVGDVLVKQGVERGIPSKVFRLPLIVGESETGRVSIENNHILLRYLFIMKHKIMPVNPFPLLSVPVDICAQVSTALFFMEETPVGIYNVSHAKPDVEQEMVEVLQRFGHSVEMVEFSQFAKAIQDADTSGDKNSPLSIFKDYYIDEESEMGSGAGAIPILQRWIEGDDSMWISPKILKYLPSFYESIGKLKTSEFIYRDLLFLKNEGVFEKFGL